jgi:hypothetical protein
MTLDFERLEEIYSEEYLQPSVGVTAARRWPAQ